MGITFSKPDFLVVGPFKTGTTWLYNQLHLVNEVSIPPYKEISFFSEADKNRHFTEIARRVKSGTLKDDLPAMNPDKKMIDEIWAGYNFHQQKNIGHADTTGSNRWAWYYKHIPRKINLAGAFLYSKLFNSSSQKVAGDISPSYFAISAEAVRRIRKFFPELKIVFILRDPVEREWSDIRMNCYTNSQCDTGLLEKYLIKNHGDSNYKRAIPVWGKHFSQSQILYLFFDDLVNEPQKFMQQFAQFIKPGLHISELLKEKTGAGDTVEMSSEIRKRLITKNMAQYDFLLEKFGPDSYPARWRAKALADLERPDK